MNREYHVEKDLKGQYLWIDREGIWGEAYEENILRKQKITGLIPFYETENMGEVHLVYSLEYRKNFIGTLKNGRMKCLQMESLIKSMIQMMHMMDEYLLDPSNLVMEMDYFYENGDGWDFIYIPGYQADFWTQMEKLSEVWLNYVDYGDERAVLWAYAFYEKVHGDMCSVETLDEITQMEKTIMNKTSVSYIAEDGGSMDHKDHLKKDKATFWQYIRKKMKCRTEKYSKKEKEVSEFFRKENTLEDTCPVLNLTEEFDISEGKTMIWIPMGGINTEVIRFENVPALIGRALEEVDVCLSDLRVSRIHARIDYKNGQVVIVDMNSSNGSYRNGEKLKSGEAYSLHAGDIIKLADFEFICQWCA